MEARAQTPIMPSMTLHVSRAFRDSKANMRFKKQITEHFERASAMMNMQLLATMLCYRRVSDMLLQSH